MVRGARPSSLSCVWAVAERGAWDEPKTLVRVDLRSGACEPVDLPAADTFDSLAYVPAHRKVLVCRAGPENGKKRVAGPDEPEYYLLDAATGAVARVTGDVAPWRDQSIRPLQPTGVANEVWVAKYDAARGTTVGRYDTLRFQLTPVAVYPEIKLWSMRMWVDERSQHVYVAYADWLVRLPLVVKPK